MGDFRIIEVSFFQMSKCQNVKMSKFSSNKFKKLVFSFSNLSGVLCGMNQFRKSEKGLLLVDIFFSN